MLETITTNSPITSIPTILSMTPKTTMGIRTQKTGPQWNFSTAGPLFFSRNPETKDRDPQRGEDDAQREGEEPGADAGGGAELVGEGDAGEETADGQEHDARPEVAGILDEVLHALLSPAAAPAPPLWVLVLRSRKPPPASDLPGSKQYRLRARPVSARADAYLASPIILAISRYAFVRSAMKAGILS